MSEAENERAVCSEAGASGELAQLQGGGWEWTSTPLAALPGALASASVLLPPALRLPASPAAMPPTARLQLPRRPAPPPSCGRLDARSALSTVQCRLLRRPPRRAARRLALHPPLAGAPQLPQLVRAQGAAAGRGRRAGTPAAPLGQPPSSTDTLPRVAASSCALCPRPLLLRRYQPEYSFAAAKFRLARDSPARGGGGAAASAEPARASGAAPGS